jgi:hypothetical protein
LPHEQAEHDQPKHRGVTREDGRATHMDTVEKSISLELRPELGAQRLFQGRNDAVSELSGVLVGERPLR